MYRRPPESWENGSLFTRPYPGSFKEPVLQVLICLRSPDLRPGQERGVELSHGWVSAAPSFWSEVKSE